MSSENPVDRTPESGGSGPGRRVLIDALAARFGGTAYATAHLARQFARRAEVSSVIVATRADSIVERELADEPMVRCITLPAADRIELLRRVSWEALRLPALVASEGCDVVITMSGMLPRQPGSSVVCLLFNPVMYERRTAANAIRRWAVRRTARDAAYVAAPSRVVAELVSASTGRPCEVVPLGVDHEVFYPTNTRGEGILCVADFYAHKRHDLILDAWCRLAPPRPQLRLIGNPSVDPRAHAQLLARIGTLPEADLIVFESDLPLRRLVEAYQHARLFVLPSEHESFCMPLVESMACGVPPVVRDLASVRETGGDGATYINGDDPGRWAAALQTLIDDDFEHQRARESALRVAARFSWEGFAAKLVAQL
jgi:glycosyltransferase involved in cell wall biosynthesis